VKGKNKGSRRAKKDTSPRSKAVGRGLYIVVAIVGALGLGLGGGWLLARQRATGPTTPEIKLAPASQLSGKVAMAPPLVREAYRFAIAYPTVLSKLPCYCGCGGKGHKSNLDCFVERFEPDGRVAFSFHALN